MPFLYERVVLRSPQSILVLSQDSSEYLVHTKILVCCEPEKGWQFQHDYVELPHPNSHNMLPSELPYYAAVLRKAVNLQHLTIMPDLLWNLAKFAETLDPHFGLPKRLTLMKGFRDALSFIRILDDVSLLKRDILADVTHLELHAPSMHFEGAGAADLVVRRFPFVTQLGWTVLNTDLHHPRTFRAYISLVWNPLPPNTEFLVFRVIARNVGREGMDIIQRYLEEIVDVYRASSPRNRFAVLVEDESLIYEPVVDEHDIWARARRLE